MQNFKVITTISGFQIESYDKENITKLADFLDKLPGFNVTEIVFSWATDQCIIRVYPDQNKTNEDLQKLINKYYGLPE